MNIWHNVLPENPLSFTMKEKQRERLREESSLNIKFYFMGVSQI